MFEVGGIGEAGVRLDAETFPVAGREHHHMAVGLVAAHAQHRPGITRQSRQGADFDKAVGIRLQVRQAGEHIVELAAFQFDPVVEVARRINRDSFACRKALFQFPVFPCRNLGAATLLAFGAGERRGEVRVVAQAERQGSAVGIMDFRLEPQPFPEQPDRQPDRMVGGPLLGRLGSVAVGLEFTSHMGMVRFGSRADHAPSVPACETMDRCRAIVARQRQAVTSAGMVEMSGADAVGKREQHGVSASGGLARLEKVGLGVEQFQALPVVRHRPVVAVEAQRRPNGGARTIRSFEHHEGAVGSGGRFRSADLFHREIHGWFSPGRGGITRLY